MQGIGVALYESSRPTLHSSSPWPTYLTASTSCLVNTRRCGSGDVANGAV